LDWNRIGHHHDHHHAKRTGKLKVAKAVQKNNNTSSTVLTCIVFAATCFVGAPTKAVEPSALMATADPNWSPLTAGENGRSVCVWAAARWCGSLKHRIAKMGSMATEVRAIEAIQ
jgi:hypothetical protein